MRYPSAKRANLSEPLVADSKETPAVPDINSGYYVEV